MSYKDLSLDEIFAIGRKWGMFFSAFDDAVAKECDFDYLIYNAEYSNSDYWIDVLYVGIEYCLESGMKVPQELLSDARSFLEDDPKDDSAGQPLLRLVLQKV